MSEKKSLFDMMSPTQAFVFGIVEGILVLCTIGFFIMVLGGVDMSGEKGRTVRTGSDTAAVADTAGAQVSIPEVTKDDHIRGNEDAAITIVEYSDIECPFCARFHDTMKDIVDMYGDDVRWVYRHFPLDSLHPNARAAAIASECAAEQGAFWEFVDLASTRQGTLDTDGIEGVADDIDINITKFNKCLADGAYAAVVEQDSKDAQAAGGRGTPYSILVGPDGSNTVISGAQPFENVEAQITRFLQ